MGSLDKILKAGTAVAAGFALSGTSPAINPPLYVNCVGASEAVQDKTCRKLVRILRDKQIPRMIAQGTPTARKPKMAQYITLHMQAVGGDGYNLFFSWNSAAGKMINGPKVRMSKSNMNGKSGDALAELVAQTDLPLLPRPK